MSKDLQGLSLFEMRLEPFQGTEPGLMTASVLMVVCKKSEQMIVEKLALMTDANFEEEVPGYGRPARRGYKLFFLKLHHVYHIGQLELLRNLAGYTEKFI